MNAACSYDINLASVSAFNITVSDCYQNCISYGCTYDMLYNSICDQSNVYLDCNNPYCGWDNGQCKTCNPVCFTNPDSCIYNKSDTYAECAAAEKLLAFVNKLRYKNLNYQTDLNTCFDDSVSSESCSSTKLSSSTCNISCNNQDCAYGLGKCIESSCDSSCGLCFEANNAEACFSCSNTSSYLYYSKCFSSCLPGFSNRSLTFKKPDLQAPDISIKLCEPPQDTTEKSNPKIMYVTSDRSLDSVTSDGSMNAPYTHLTLALANISKRYTAIYLLNINKSVHYLDDFNRSLHSIVAEYSKQYDPLDIYALSYSKIQILPYICSDSSSPNCYNEGTRPIIQWSGSNVIQITVSSKLEISGIDIWGYNSISSQVCTNFIYCTYCPNFSTNNGTTTTDRNEVFTSIYARSQACANYNSKYLFYIKPGGDLILSDVKIYDWRAQFQSLIYLEGSDNMPSLELKNVEFENVMAARELDNAGIIVLDKGDCSSSYKCGKISYVGGSVRLLNNGYEYKPNLSFRGFMYLIAVDELIIEDVIFEYNLEYQTFQPSGLSEFGMIYIEEFKKITVESCTFRYTFVSNSLFYLKLTTEYDRTINAMNHYEDYEITHINFSNNLFENNYATLIQLQSASEHPNMIFSNNSFTNNTVGSSDDYLININMDSYYPFWYDGDTRTVPISDNSSVTVIISPRSVTIEDITIEYCYAVSSLMHLQRLVNLNIVDMSISNTVVMKEYETSYLNDLVYQHFLSYPSSYIKTSVDFSSSDSDDDLPHAVYMQNIRGFNISSLILSDNLSSDGCTDIYIDTLYFDFKILSATITDNICSCSQSIGITAISIEGDVIITDLQASNNHNSAIEGYGVLYLTSNAESSILIEDSSFDSIYSDSVPGAYISIDSIIIRKVTFTNNNMNRANTAALYIDPPGYSISVSIDISTSQFLANINSKESGGALYITNSSGKYRLFSLIISSSTFNSNQVESEGAAITITSTVLLSSTSIISDTTFSNNISPTKGNLKLEYSQGILTLDSCKFEENQSSDGIGLYISISSSQIHLNSVEFVSNISIDNTGSVIHLSDSSSKSTILTDNCYFYHNNATAIKLEYDNWVDSYSSFISNSAYQGAVLYAISKSEASLTGTIITSNSVTESGGCMSLSGSSKITLRDCKVSNNTSNVSGGVISMEQKSIINIYNSDFFENTAYYKGSVIYSIGCTILSIISNSKLYNNKSGQGGVIILLSSNLEISDSEIYSNTFTQQDTSTNGIMASLSTISLYNTVFYDQNAKYGGSIYLTTDSIAIIDTCTFRDSIVLTGGALFSLSSKIKVSKSHFINLNADTAAGLLIYTSSVLNITDSYFINCNTYTQEAGSIVKSFESSVEIHNSFFEKFYSTGIQGSKLSRLHIKNSHFKQGKGIYGGAINCEKCKDVVLYRDTFYNNTAIIGGGAYFTTTSDTAISSIYEISHCNFSYNNAVNGGGMYSENIDITISYSNFEYNTAGDDSNLGDGGGIMLKCPDIKDTACQFDIVGNSFTFNTATRNGGAIAWLDFLPIIETNNLFIHNTAQYAPNIASFASALAVVDEDLNILYSPSTRLLIEGNLNMVHTLQGLAPGQTTTQPLLIALIDVYQQIVTTDSISTAELTKYNSDASLYDGTKVIAASGVFNFSSFTIDAVPESTIQMMVSSTGVMTDLSEYSNVTVVPQILISVELRACQMGESNSGKRCVLCESGKYSLNPEDETCKACPSEADCYGGYNIVPKAKYWRKDMYSDIFYECLNTAACLGSPSAPDTYIYSGDCATGYTGNLCQGCRDGYSRTSKNECGVCPDAVGNAMKLTGILIAVIIVCVIMVKTTMDSAYKQKSLQSIYIKILFNYLQLVMLTATFDLDWPEYVLEVFSIQEKAGSATDQIFSVDCFISDKGGSNYTSEDVYYFKLITMLALPILIVIVSVIVWSLIACYYKTLKYFKSELMATIVILVFLVHPNIVKAMFSAFSCMEIEGESWLLENLEIQCWDSRHSLYATTIALPGIIVWGLGIPAVCLFYLFKNRRSLNVIRVRLKFGFLFNGYKTTHFYWEFVILYRKILIIFCSVFLSNLSIPLQALTVMIVLLISLHIQNTCNPYSHASLNEMEIRSILVAAVTIYCGLYYLTGDLNETAKITFFIMIVVSNAYFLYYWLMKLLEVSLAKFAMRIPCLKRRFVKEINDGFENDLFVSSPSNEYVIKRNGDIMFSLINNQAQENRYVKKEIDYIDILCDDTKYFYMRVVRAKLKKEPIAVKNRKTFEETRLEEIQESHTESEDLENSDRSIGTNNTKVIDLI